MLWAATRVDYNVVIVLYCAFHMQHCCDSTTMWRCHLFGSNFHRNSLEREETMPVSPINPVAWKSVCAEVQSIQVCVVTRVVPPASLVPIRTAPTAPVVVPIPRGECHAVMIAERITWNKNNVTNPSESPTLRLLIAHNLHHPITMQKMVILVIYLNHTTAAY